MIFAWTPEMKAILLDSLKGGPLTPYGQAVAAALSEITRLTVRVAELEAENEELQARLDIAI